MSRRPSSAREQDPPPRLVRALARFAALAVRERVRWYVFGARAVALHGIPRTTEDLDITFDLGEHSPARWANALDRAGFALKFKDEAFVAATRVLPVIDRATKMPIDLVLAGPGLEQQFFDRAEHLKVGRTEVPVLALEDLVVTKVLAGRPKDLQDVRELIAMHPRIDHRAVERVLDDLEEVLDQSDLRPLYARLRREA